jgi:hypothetical protein
MSRRPLSRRRFLSLSGVAAGSVWLPWRARASVRDTQIVRAAIHPAIGVARVGNSRRGFYVGPEITAPALTMNGQMRDEHGAIKRQAARFRIYGYNAAGEVVRELTAADAEIQWSVHLANKKSAWYRFVAALDIPESRELKTARRNPSVEDRASLVIDPGPRAVAGRSKAGARYRFDSGKFEDTKVYLGELRTDGEGRLLVLGGLGKSESPGQKPVYNPDEGDTFNNADGWYDDTADGPVDAEVVFEGRRLPVEGAWVFSAPPNYAPDVVGWRTMHDLIVDTYVAAGRLPEPAVTSFQEDILPILQRLSGLQWVNKGFSDLYGRGTKLDFWDAKILSQLSGPANFASGFAEFRKHIYDSFRLSHADPSDKRKWPMIYGDAFGTFDDSPRVDLAVSDLRGLHLRRWIEGKFVNDFAPSRLTRAVASLESLPVADQPAMLDKAALHFCLADAFHPGCELTWPMRHVSMYADGDLMKEKWKRFRIRRASGREADYGKFLTAGKALAANGPLHAQRPGDLTKWMAVPWQGDTIFCRSGYEPDFDPYLPTFWPARVPNHVLTESDYRTVMDESLPREERLRSYRRRENWTRLMYGSAPQQILLAVREFGTLGMIEARPGVKNDKDFPAVMLVENLPPMPVGAAGGQESQQRGGKGLGAGRDSEDPVQKAGWESMEQLEEFRRMRGIKRP